MKYKLDLDEELFDFEGWAFIHFQTLAPGYAFADSLNRLFDYRLARIDDMPIDDIAWPFYRHEDTVRHMTFFLTERPAAAINAPWEPGNKLLIVRSENAAAEVRRIHSDFTAPDIPDPADLLACERANLLTNLLAEFTVATPLDFENPAPSRKAERERTLIMHLCDKILAHIERHHLDLSRVDRMRLEMRQKRQQS